MGLSVMPGVRLAVGAIPRSAVYPDTKANARPVARLDARPYAGPDMGVDVMPDAEPVVRTIPRPRRYAGPDLRLDITLDARADVRLNVRAAVGLYARPARSRTNTGRYTSIMPVLSRLKSQVLKVTGHL